MQIYGMSINGGKADKLTTDGSRNSSPKYSPDGKSIVFTSVDDKGDSRITMLDLTTNKSQILTSTNSRKPSFSPSGERILFATESNGRGIIATVTKNGRVKQKMFPQQGDIFDPAWGPQ